MISKKVLGIRVDLVNLNDALKLAREYLTSQGQHKIFTPNPEMIVKAQNDSEFMNVLNKSDLSICDGFGLHLISRAPRITGVDFMTELCRLAAEQGRSVYLIGSGEDEVVKNTAIELKKKFDKLIISGFDKGPLIANEDYIADQSLDRIRETRPDILFVAFGMGKQEKWIDKNIDKLPSVKIAMGVGGAFDFISGKISRAPLFLRKIGLEWLYRFYNEPARIKRIFNATIKFIYLVLVNRKSVKM